jgi:hypothetical protein
MENYLLHPPPPPPQHLVLYIQSRDKGSLYGIFYSRWRRPQLFCLFKQQQKNLRRGYSND